MRKKSLEFLKRLVETPSVSGFEQSAQRVCAEYVAPYVDRVHKDVVGNQFAVRDPNAEFRVLLDAHVDEIGLMITHIDDQGFLSFAAVGGVDPVVLSAQCVRIHTRKGVVQGVVGKTPPHLTEPKKRGARQKMHEMWIDIAAKDKKRAEKLVSVGDPVTIDSGFVPLRDEKVAGRGFDDRVGAFVIIEAMRLLARRKLDCGIHCATVVQEELGMRGARAGAYTVDPHVGLAVEFGWTTDHPGVNKKQFGDRAIDKGPLISRGPNINPILHKQLVATAKKHKIPYQIAPEPRSTPTDANVIQLTRAGVATALVRVPGRYLHSPVELLSLRDVEYTVKLIVEWVCSLHPRMKLIP